MKNLSGKNILVVDDEELLREIIVEELSYHGATVTDAENGTIAFELIKKNKFDAVITDIRMPGGGGIALIKNINTLSSQQPKIFICSGYNDVSEDEINSLGVVFTFNKPFDREKFIEVVEKKLKAS